MSRAPKGKKSEGERQPKEPAVRKPLTAEEIQFCTNYCETGNQAESFRSVWPDAKNPHTSATRLMKRAEIKDFINRTLQVVEQRGAESAGRALLLRLDVADGRLAEILSTRRRSRGEMLTRDTRALQLPGVTSKRESSAGGKGRPAVKFEKTPEFEASLDEEAPVEDIDLLKAIDLTYKRRVGYPQQPPPKNDNPTPVNVILYEPAWKKDRERKDRPTIEAEVKAD